jgi:photosystem II stability/assembly factor-like uncharacterized protein
MNRKNIIIVSLIFFISTTIVFAQSNWFWLNPVPTGNSMYKVNVINSSTIYILTDGNVLMKSTDNGNTWTSKLIPDDNGWVYSMHFTSATNGFVVGGSGKVLRTTDSGTSWSTSSIILPYSLYDVYFPSPDTGFAVGDYYVLKTVNGGDSWDSLSIGSSRLTAVHFSDNRHGFAATDYDGIILRTTNGGNNWDQISTGFSSTSFYSVFSVDTNITYVGGDDGSIIKTTDGGDTWNSISHLPSNSYSVNAFAFSSASLGYACSIYGDICKTTNGGNSWVTLYSDPLNGFNSLSISGLGNGFGVGSKGLIVKSTDLTTWNTLRSSIVDDRLYDVFFTDQNTGFICSDGGKILKTTNSGSSWTIKYDNFSTSTLSSICFPTPQIGYSAVDNGSIVLKTTNSGENWNSISTGKNGSISQIFFSDTSTGYMCGFVSGFTGGVFKTTNGGNSWQQLTLPTSDYFGGVTFISDQIGFAASTSNIFKTTDGGDTWASVYAGGGQWGPMSFPTSNIGYATGVGGFILKTTDGGNVWTQSTDPVASLATSLYFADANTGYLCASFGVISKTTNGGSTWINQFSSTGNNPQSIFFTNLNTGYVVGWEGTILKTIDGGGTTSVSEKDNNLPRGFQLSQNYPNPFNPITTISYQLPFSGPVTIKVYDLLGREVATLLNEEKSAGSYEVNFNASGISSGIYFYKLQADSFSETKKLILLK